MFETLFVYSNLCAALDPGAAHTGEATLMKSPSPSREEAYAPKWGLRNEAGSPNLIELPR